MHNATRQGHHETNKAPYDWREVLSVLHCRGLRYLLDVSGYSTTLIPPCHLISGQWQEQLCAPNGQASIQSLGWIWFTARTGSVLSFNSLSFRHTLRLIHHLAFAPFLHLHPNEAPVSRTLSSVTLPSDLSQISNLSPSMAVPQHTASPALKLISGSELSPRVKRPCSST